jgi:monoamine oxidase
MSCAVCVIGGGASGLYTALCLKKEGITNVVVLEARDRVGGRTHSEKMGAGVEQVFVSSWCCFFSRHFSPVQVVDVGGQWVGPQQKRLMDLISRYKLVLREQFDEGKHVLEFKSKLFHYTGGISELDLEGTEELQVMWQKLDGLAEKIDVSNPWNSCGAFEYDSVTLRNWLQKNASEDTTRRLVEWFARVCIATEPSEISLLYFLTWLKSGGLYASLVNIKGGAQNFVVAGGMQQVANSMRQELEAGICCFFVW